MGKPGKKHKGGLYQVFSSIQCVPCRKKRKRDAPPSPIDHAEKNGDPSSPAVRTTPPPLSPHAQSSPFDIYTDSPHIATTGGRIDADRTLVASPTHQPSQSAWKGSKDPDSPPISHLLGTDPSHRGTQQDSETLTVDSDQDNVDRIFDEAWKPGNGISLADGSELPWSKGRSSPSAAAGYLDDIEDGH